MRDTHFCWRKSSHLSNGACHQSLSSSWIMCFLWKTNQSMSMCHRRMRRGIQFMTNIGLVWVNLVTIWSDKSHHGLQLIFQGNPYRINCTSMVSIKACFLRNRSSKNLLASMSGHQKRYMTMLSFKWTIFATTTGTKRWNKCVPPRLFCTWIFVTRWCLTCNTKVLT